MRTCYIYILSICFLHCSCKKFLDIPAPKTQTVSSVIFENDAAAVSAVTGLYSEITRGNLNIMSGGFTLHTALSGDELYNTSPNADLDMFTNNSLLATNSFLLSRLWAQGYKNIYQCNAVLEGLEKSNTLTDSVKRQLKGEMLLTRAFNFYLFTQLFGDVPLILSTDYRANAILPKKPIGDILSQLITDLTEARQLMSGYYVNSNRTRPNKWAASVLLARIYLIKGEWQKAEDETNAVIQSGKYSLNPVLASVFLPNSPETIWQMSRDNNNTSEGAAFIPSSSTVKPVYSLRQGLIDAFAINDQRKDNWIKQQVVGGQPYYYPIKYKVRTSTTISEYYVVMRLAEVYLIRAEARARLQNIAGAQSDVNIVRQRAGLGNTTASDEATLQSAIANERRTELFMEWGQRWTDLKRTQQADIVLGALKGSNWQSTDQLYPIPQDEINSNPFLIQNPGY